MPRTLKRLLTPRWIGVHLGVWAAAVAMVFLGRWQLDVSNSKHFDLQNFGYALQWWAFSTFAILLWLRGIRDTIRGGGPAPSTDGALVLRSGQTGLAFAGPATLMAPAEQPGEAPIIYRGYRMPQSSTRPTRSGGDPLHSAYNDYLWQLALADGANPDPPIPPPFATAADSPAPADDPPPSAIAAPDVRAITEGNPAD